MDIIYGIVDERNQYINGSPDGGLVMDETRPSIDHKCQDDGDGTGTWVLDTDYIGEEVRTDRNKLLLECDYTVLSDSQVDDQAAWVTYRQSLRDITDQVGFPETIDWPDRPE